jgi:hypothetical protein
MYTHVSEYKDDQIKRETKEILKFIQEKKLYIKYIPSNF